MNTNKQEEPVIQSPSEKPTKEEIKKIDTTIQPNPTEELKSDDESEEVRSIDVSKDEIVVEKEVEIFMQNVY